MRSVTFLKTNRLSRQIFTLNKRNKNSMSHEYTGEFTLKDLEKVIEMLGKQAPQEELIWPQFMDPILNKMINERISNQQSRPINQEATAMS